MQKVIGNGQGYMVSLPITIFIYHYIASLLTYHYRYIWYRLWEGYD